MNHRISVGDNIRLTAVKPVHGGAMIGWYENTTVFVEGALPGEEVTARVTQVRSRFVRAQVVSVDREHPDRQAPSCPAAAQGSGCCDYSIAKPELQRHMKLAVVHDQLERLAQLDKNSWPQEVSQLSAEDTGWRIRQRYTIDPKGELGSFRKWSNELIPRRHAECVQEASGLKRISLAEGLAPGSEVVLALGDDGNSHAVNLCYPRRNKHKVRSARAQATARRAEREKRPDRTILWGSGQVTQRVGGKEWVLPAECFWQAHINAAAKYAELVTQEADLVAGDRAWDLYGGCGVFAQALILAQPEVASVKSVDVDPRSIRAGEVAFSNDDRVVIRQSRVEQWLQRVNENPGTVVLDPPRAGAGKKVIELISRNTPHTVLHFGCDPASFARDLADWRRCGYGVKKLDVFDAFPGTHHMECFAKLEPLT